MRWRCWAAQVAFSLPDTTTTSAGAHGALEAVCVALYCSSRKLSARLPTFVWMAAADKPRPTWEGAVQLQARGAPRSKLTAWILPSAVDIKSSHGRTFSGSWRKRGGKETVPSGLWSELKRSVSGILRTVGADSDSFTALCRPVSRNRSRCFFKMQQWVKRDESDILSLSSLRLQPPVCSFS